MGLVFAHFPAPVRAHFHARLSTYLKPGGLVIFEAFSKDHLKLRAENPQVGGPPVLEMLFSTDEVRKEFPGFEVLELEQVEVELSEGQFHVGLSSVVRFVGRKNG